MKFTLREPGMPASVALHGALLIAGIVSFSSPKPFADTQEAIAVEVIDESALREVMKGERQAKPQPTPTPRVDRVDDKKEQNAPGEAKRQVNADATPKPQEATAKEERKEVTAAVTVPSPPPMPRIVPPAPPKPVEAAKPPEPPKPAPPKPVAAKPLAAVPPKPAESTEEEEDEKAEEVIRQAARKKAEEQKKLEEQRRAQERLAQERVAQERAAEERRKAEDQKRQDDARKQEQAKQEQAKAEQQKREQDEARKREELKKVADAKAAEDRKKAEDAKKAQEAAKKAADERRKREAEQEARNQATADAARRALLASREAPSNSGNTGQQVSRTPSQGTPTATGQRLNPAERGQLVGMIADQIRACWNVPVSGKPSVLPQVRVALNQDGSLSAQPTLINSSGDPLFRAVADSGMRAIRQCSPFRIPARFVPMYGDWRSLVVQLNPDD